MIGMHEVSVCDPLELYTPASMITILAVVQAIACIGVYIKVTKKNIIIVHDYNSMLTINQACIQFFGNVCYMKGSSFFLLYIYLHEK